MIVYIDENLSPHLARGLNLLQAPMNGEEKEPIEIQSIKDVFGQGTTDEEWIPKAGKQGAIVVTQDLNIHRTRSQFELFQQHGLGIFFFRPPSNRGYLYWDMVQQVINRWAEMKKLAFKTKKPFAFKCTSRSSHFEEFNKT